MSDAPPPLKFAFDTVFAEAQRRFVESMSTYAQQFIQQLERPPVDSLPHSYGMSFSAEGFFGPSSDVESTNSNGTAAIAPASASSTCRARSRGRRSRRSSSRSSSAALCPTRPCAGSPTTP